jgi:hypothetical protein
MAGALLKDVKNTTARESLRKIAAAIEVHARALRRSVDHSTMLTPGLSAGRRWWRCRHGPLRRSGYRCDARRCALRIIVCVASSRAGGRAGGRAAQAATDAKEPDMGALAELVNARFTRMVKEAGTPKGALAEESSAPPTRA